jgi:hypothetical protein
MSPEYVNRLKHVFGVAAFLNLQAEDDLSYFPQVLRAAGRNFLRHFLRDILAAT